MGLEVELERRGAVEGKGRDGGRIMVERSCKIFPIPLTSSKF